MFSRRSAFWYFPDFKWFVVDLFGAFELHVLNILGYFGRILGILEDYLIFFNSQVMNSAFSYFMLLRSFDT